MKDGEATNKEVTPWQRKVEVNRAIRAIKHITGLHARDGKLPEGVDETAITEAREVMLALKATDVATMMLTENISGDASLFLWNRTRRAMYALSPVVAMRIAAKLDDKDAPGSERILSEVAKGLGLLVPGAPAESHERETQIRRRDLADMTDDELERMLNQQRGAEEADS